MTFISILKELKSQLVLFRLYFRVFKSVSLYNILIDSILNREKERIISINGFKIYVRTNSPDVKVAISSLYFKEYDSIRCFNPKIIIDAGANIGTSSIFFAEKYPNALIIAIEPEEMNYKLLVKNTSSYKNIITINSALWGTIEKRTLQNRFTGHWGYTIANTTNSIETTNQEIKCITMESIIKTYTIDSIDILKMDIEGSEKNVLENSKKWIDLVKVLSVELHDRICIGCDRAFYLATKDFEVFEKNKEKVTAYKTKE